MIKELPKPKAASPETFFDLLRLHVDIAAAEKMTYLQISYKTDTMDKVNSVSISCP